MPPLTDIPASLYALADRLDGEEFEGQVVVITDSADGSFDVAAYGRTDSMQAQAAVATAAAHMAALRLGQR